MAARKGTTLDESGGESVTVTVSMNGNIVFVRTATITGSPGNSPNRRYTTDDGDIINHNHNRNRNRNQGYKELARKMLVK